MIAYPQLHGVSQVYITVGGSDSTGRPSRLAPNILLENELARRRRQLELIQQPALSAIRLSGERVWQYEDRIKLTSQPLEAFTLPVKGVSYHRISRLVPSKGVKISETVETDSKLFGSHGFLRNEDFFAVVGMRVYSLTETVSACRPESVEARLKAQMREAVQDAITCLDKKEKLAKLRQLRKLLEEL